MHKNKIIPIAYPSIDSKEISAVEKVLKSKQLAQGSSVDEFEKSFSDYIGVRYAIATSNGTTALHLALLGLGIKEGDEVITTPFSFIASTNAIIYCGAKPVFVDIDPLTFNIDANQIEKKITKRTKAILPVHLYGNPADMSKIISIAKKYKLKILEDACQSHGALFNNRPVGSMGDAGCFSFYPTKNMTTGEGGIITTNSKVLARKLRLLRNQGMEKRYHHEIVGYNFRMTNIAAAIGIEQLKKLNSFNKERISNAAFLTKGLKKIKGIQVPQSQKNSTHVYHQYTLRITEDFGINRYTVANHLENMGIGIGVYYPVPIHLQKPYKNFANISLPESVRAAKEVLSIPVHPNLSKKDLNKIITSIKELSKLNPKAKL